MQLKRKLPWILTGKSLLAVGSIAMVALALVTYSETINISFSAFFVQGVSSTGTWTMTTSSGSRYLPGLNVLTGVGTPVAPTASNSSSYAFYTITGLGFVQIKLASSVPTVSFQKFNIFVLSWSGSAWVNATVFATSALSTRIVGGIDGTGVNATAIAGFIQINTGAQTFYAIQVNYVLQATPGAATSAIFQYTPSLN